jgi:hypothetical protein
VLALLRSATLAQGPSAEHRVIGIEGHRQPVQTVAKEIASEGAFLLEVR